MDNWTVGLCGASNHYFNNLLVAKVVGLSALVLVAVVWLAALAMCLNVDELFCAKQLREGIGPREHLLGRITLGGGCGQDGGDGDDGEECELHVGVWE